MKRILLVVTVLAGCATTHAVGRVENMANTTTVTGIAQNAKSGAVVVTADGPIYLENLAAWPEATLGKKVKATGVRVERDGGGTPATGGIVGAYSVLTDAHWEVE